MTQKIAIIGGGLAGVYAAYRLRGLGIDFDLFEARDRLGGRILATEAGGFDLGPTWFWPDCQPRIQNLVTELGLATFQQYEEGDALVERWATDLVRREGYRSGSVSMRIEGGISRLVQALADTLPQARVHLNALLTGVTQDEQGIRLMFSEDRFPSSTYSQIWLAIPPRLAARVPFTPSLSRHDVQQMVAVPTWMASHAKYVARYASPFWREDGLSGAAFSGVGPLGEVHDASNENGAALFGFLSMNAARRQSMSTLDLKTLCREQLKRLFGEEAATPIEDFIYDWAKDPFTATDDDQVSQGWHGRHELSRSPNSTWHETLQLIGSEVGGDQAGYMEGALVAVETTLAGLNQCEGCALLGVKE